MSASWPVKTLGDVISLEYGKPLPKEDRDPEGAFPVYGANGEKARSNKFYHSTPTIIVGRKGSAGELNLTEGKFWPLDVTFFVTFDEEKYEMKFLYYLLQTLNLPSMAKGVKPGINRNDVYALKVRIPPKEEQQRIVSILDDLFEKYKKIDILILERERFVSELFQSLLDSFTDSEHGITKTLIELTENHKKDIVDGPFGSNLKREHYVKEGTPVLKIQNIKPFEIRLHKMDYVSEEKAVQLERHSFQKGDIIMTKLGDPLGVSAIVDELDRGIIVADLVRIRANKINTKFLCYQLNSPRIKAHINSFQKGSTRPRVRITIVRDLPIIVPSISEQERIVNILDEASILINRFRSNNNGDLYLQLKQSILQEAFNGNL